MRESRMDNMRFLLIFLVVLGHFFEVSQNPLLMNATELIYSFHMPVFVFVSGYFAKFNTQRIVRTYLYSYVLLQIIYIFFIRYYLGNSGFAFQFSVPCYTLWYLPAMAFYTILIPVIQTESAAKRMCVLAASVAVSLFAGADPSVGYSFASGRFFGFLPFFILGFYCRSTGAVTRLCSMKIPFKVLCGAALAVIVAAAEAFIIKSPSISFNDMTYSFTYSQTVGGFRARAFLLAAGFLWIILLLLAAPKKKIPLISNIGANTFPVYIFHGFVVKILIKNEITDLNVKAYVLIAVACSLLLTAALGNKIVSAVAKWGFTGHWISFLDKKTKRKKTAID